MISVRLISIFGTCRKEIEVKLFSICENLYCQGFYFVLATIDVLCNKIKKILFCDFFTGQALTE